MDHRTFGTGRRGFTLLELLVVLAISGVLIALLMPAVQQAREAGRRTVCLGNLRQVGIALANYADVHSRFPAGGWIPSAFRPGFVNMHSGWSAACVPYLEGGIVYELLNLRRPYFDLVNRTASQVVLPIYLCPTRARLGTQHAAPGDPFPSGESDYGGIYGPRSIPRPTDRNDPPRGAFIYWRALRPADILDGLSQTAFCGETDGGLHALWASGRNVFDQAAAINARPPLEFGQELTSEHPGGANAVFGDGAARLLHETMDLTPLAALCTRADGDDLHHAW